MVGLGLEVGSYSFFSYLFSYGRRWVVLELFGHSVLVRTKLAHAFFGVHSGWQLPFFFYLVQIIAALLTSLSLLVIKVMKLGQVIGLWFAPKIVSARLLIVPLWNTKWHMAAVHSVKDFFDISRSKRRKQREGGIYTMQCQLIISIVLVAVARDKIAIAT